MCSFKGLVSATDGVDAAAQRRRFCKQVDGSVPGAKRRETGGVSLGENLPEILVNLWDVGLEENHWILNLREPQGKERQVFRHLGTQAVISILGQDMVGSWRLATGGRLCVRVPG